MSAIALDRFEREDAVLVAIQIGAVIRRAREDRKLTRKMLAQRLGTHETSIKRIELGLEHNVKLGSLMRLLRYFNLTIDVRKV